MQQLLFFPASQSSAIGPHGSHPAQVRAAHEGAPLPSPLPERPLSPPRNPFDLGRDSLSVNSYRFSGMSRSSGAPPRWVLFVVYAFFSFRGLRTTIYTRRRSLNISGTVGRGPGDLLSAQAAVLFKLVPTISSPVVQDDFSLASDGR